ncbi:hypothetical protein DIPPA_35102, partial [Diplonema papillatum]
VEEGVQYAVQTDMIKCRHCQLKGDHLSANCPQRPASAVTEAPPPECEYYEENELEASEVAVAEMQRRSLIRKGLLSEEADEETLKKLKPG